MAKVRVEFEDKQLKRNIKDFDSKLKRGIELVFDRRALLATAWLKANARWIDRTGAARSGLLAVHNSGRSFDEILMAYSVHYGIWLEVAHDRKWAVIQPAIRVMGAALMQDLEGLIDRIEKMGSAGAIANSPAASPPLPPVVHKHTDDIRKKHRRDWDT